VSVKHVNRKNQVYHLHAKPGKSGKPNYFFSTDADGPLANTIPGGYEIYENVPGQVFLRLASKKAITEDELSLVRASLASHAEVWRYKAEARKNTIGIHEASVREPLFDQPPPWIDEAKLREYEIRNAYYTAVMRFILADRKKRLFTPERFCFRGSGDRWICLGEARPLPALLKELIKHLGKPSFYQLF
jgi:hypothetical protein